MSVVKNFLMLGIMHAVRVLLWCGTDQKGLSPGRHQAII